MGLTAKSTGINAADSYTFIKRTSPNQKIVAIAGNPNVGKSTIFNNLTGMNQHTGNWPGKTVSNAQGYCSTKNNSYILVDIPGTYSLMAHSAEEEIARNFICFGDSDAVIIVCDATCLERNLNLVLQTLEITRNAIVCVNLLDEAKRKHIYIDLDKLSEKLGVKVIGTVGRKKKSLDSLLLALDNAVINNNPSPLKISYIDPIEQAISLVETEIKSKINTSINTRWLSLKLLDPDTSLLNELEKYLGEDIAKQESITLKLNEAKLLLQQNGITQNELKEKIVSAIINKAESICKNTVSYDNKTYNSFDRKIDKILTGKWVGYPVMLILLAFIFWLTISGANYPSKLLSDGLFFIEDRLTELFHYLNAPNWLHGALVLGVYRVLAWVVSVMLPPMAIFFPLFTLLEDVGYLPRVAYNLDKPFKCCRACGKQALTTCMGFGCNAAGIVGCRIIDSPRERLIAILTNNFVPCNGRFPALISIITMFFVGFSATFTDSLLSTAILTLLIIFGIFMTFFMSRILSSTVLKGVPSSFTLELPPYRKPQITKVIVRSIFDRTLFVLGRAVTVAAPAGLIIWLMANVTVNGETLLFICSDFLDPFASLLGLDGVILMAFILGFPANEIVIPIIIMAYMSNGSLVEYNSLSELHNLLINNGWTITTAISTMLFFIMHWPCSTTLITIAKETKSFKWTALSFALPTLTGMAICFLFNSIVNLVI